VMYCISKNYAGIENLSLIPGSVGAAPIQNIGAYGVELKDVLVSLEALNLKSQSIETFSNSDCKFGYRDSIFKQGIKGQYIILNITLRLNKTPAFKIDYGAIKNTLDTMQLDTISIAAISKAVIKIRQEKLPDPATLPNAGSFFKNPYIDLITYEKLKQIHPNVPTFPIDDNTLKIPAAWLIDQCGWKGKRMGACGVYENQALVLANYDNASGAQVLKLAKTIVQDVYDKFAIRLQPEVTII